ncbi:MAG: hypothetical protein RLZZ450_7611 [Pseudomonadota bacterium]|jgi:flagellar basal body-associated protein FliL
MSAIHYGSRAEELRASMLRSYAEESCASAAATFIDVAVAVIVALVAFVDVVVAVVVAFAVHGNVPAGAHDHSSLDARDRAVVNVDDLDGFDVNVNGSFPTKQTP